MDDISKLFHENSLVTGLFPRDATLGEDTTLRTNILLHQH
jgi:hypothetical protein